MLRIVAAFTGALLLLAVLTDSFYTIVMARRVQRPFLITRAFYQSTWAMFSRFGRRIRNGKAREHFLGIYGPLSLILLLSCWVFLSIVSFALLHWSAGLDTGSGASSFSTSFYFSASTLVSALSSDAHNTVSKFLKVVEAGLGLGLLALVIGYLPVLYQSFSGQEVRISLMDTRAGSPPSASELIRRHGANPDKLERQLGEWEIWAAELLESHLSYPMLGFLRSHHSNQSWLAVLTTVADASAIVLLASSGDLKRQAERTFALGRHAMVDISIAFHVPPSAPDHDRLPAPELDRLRSGLPSPLRADSIAAPELNRLRGLYEPYANALSQYFLVALPDWITANQPPDNWQLTDYNRPATPFAVSDPFQDSAEPNV